MVNSLLGNGKILACGNGGSAAEALHHALDAGAVDPQVSFSQEDNAVTNDIDGNLFFEARITATASGRVPPACWRSCTCPARSAARPRPGS